MTGQKLESVSCIYVVCSMTRADEMLTATDITKQHRLTGYSGCAVHLVITRSGDLESGRPLAKQGALAGEFNSCSLQVLLVGGLSDELLPEDNLTDAQADTLRYLLELLELPVMLDPETPL